MPWSTWSTGMPLMRWCASRTVTRSRLGCLMPRCGSTSPPCLSLVVRWRRARLSSWGTSRTAVLRGNIAPDGAVIKTAGIPEYLWHFSGPAMVVESQEEAVSAILTHKVKPGDVLVVRYEGPAGGPGMQEMLHSTAFLKGAGLDKVCALITDGRFS